MTIAQLQEALSKFQPSQEVTVMFEPTHGDVQYEIRSIDNWDVGAAPGLCVLSIGNADTDEEITTENNKPLSPESIAKQLD